MKSQVFAGAGVLVLGACAYDSTPLPDVAALQTATNPAISSPLNYSDPLAGYAYRGPTGPRDWREVNTEVTEGN